MIIAIKKVKLLNAFELLCSKFKFNIVQGSVDDWYSNASCTRCNPEISVTKDATDSIFQKVNRLFVLSFENKTAEYHI